MEIYQLLHHAYGAQRWWPAETPFEMMVGAILTQNTRWENVELALANLRERNLLEAERMGTCNQEQLAELIRPAGFFRQKSVRLHDLCIFYLDHGGIEGLKRWPTASIRARMLDVPGIGPETADSILLYALEKPVFVVDAYTRRIFGRLGQLPCNAGYGEVQGHFQQRLAHTLPLFQEFHALIVEHAKQRCRPKPLCDGCPLEHCCAKACLTPAA